MKKIILIIIAITTTLLKTYPQQQSVTLEQQAEEAYKNENYAQAAELYDQLLQEKGESPQIYYNLGNTYYKMDEIGKAILNYERAHILDPSDKDIQFNLEMAKAKKVDAIENTEPILLKRWINNFKDTLGEKGWGVTAITLFTLFLISLFLFFFGRAILLKKIGFYVGLSALLLSITANTFAHMQRHKIEERKEAVIMAATVTVKSSPDKSGTDLFLLHEGTKVSIKSTLTNWTEIELPNGNVGWIENNKIEKI